MLWGTKKLEIKNNFCLLKKYLSFSKLSFWKKRKKTCEMYELVMAFSKGGAFSREGIGKPKLKTNTVND